MDTMATRIRDLTRMNAPEFNGSKVDEDPQEFIDKFYKTVGNILVSMIEKAQLAAYQLKGVAQVWFEQWKEERVVDAGNVNVKEYSLMFTQLAKYAPTMVVHSRGVTTWKMIG
ncbi:hypothetical protein MTR67_030823 [Solanum verrucosum]|uniref:Gag-pol polyprotein n=1 Tax=Solanum verrucosum TaxID=315347 RepID=A0AAF0U1B2_SOLVR|nr:hypothetical protein MTR67_030823 [Solanum verrucosum]